MGRIRKRKASKMPMNIGEGSRKGSRSSSNQQWILEIPCHLNMEILSRLPMKTLISCRFVCKTWNTLISDPHFIKLLLSRTPLNLLYKTLPPKRESRRLQLIDLRGAKTRCSLDAKLKLTVKSNFPYIGNGPITLLGSCNGLLCLGDSETMEPIYVCNPILGEYIALPRSEWGMSGNGICCISGIGLCSYTSQYKVFRKVRHFNGDDAPAEIYTLGEGKWRNIGNSNTPTPYPYSYPSSFNTYVNGAIHWLGYGFKDKKAYIHSFHFGSEQFGVISPPAEFDKILDFNRKYLRLGELQGCLYLVKNDKNSSKVEVWLMNKYGVEESWSKTFIIKNVFPKTSYCNIYEPIMIIDSGEMLIMFNGHSLLLYNPCLGTYRHLNHTYGIRSEFDAIAHVPSLLSLKDVAKGELLKICRA